MASPTPPLTLRAPLTRRAKFYRFLRRGLLLIAGVLAFYACFLLAGFLPVNRGYAPPPKDQSVRMFIRSNEIHTDFVLPVTDEASAVDWRELFPPEHFRGDIEGSKYVAIGWGDRGFYINTPRWEDFQLSTALRAQFPHESVLRAEYLEEPAPDEAAPSESFREVQLSSPLKNQRAASSHGCDDKLSDEITEFASRASHLARVEKCHDGIFQQANSRDQYRQLVEFIRSTVGQVDDEGHAIQATSQSHNRFDRFYVATGTYHAFNTCNQWTGRGLARAGVPTGIWTPLPPQVTCWLK